MGRIPAHFAAAKPSVDDIFPRPDMSGLTHQNTFPLVEPQPLKYPVYGFTTDQEKQLRQIVDVMQPGQYPELGIVMLGPSEFRQQKMLLARRGFQANNGSAMNIGRGYTIPGIPRIYMDGSAWDTPQVFFQVLAHEFGHRLAGSDTSEGAADKLAKPMHSGCPESRSRNPDSP